MRRLIAGGLLVLLLGVLTSRLLDWWPCTVGCQGGGAYARLFGLPVEIFALIGGSVVGVLLAVWPRWAGLLAGGLAGGSLLFLGLAWHLELACSFCITVHVLILALAAATFHRPLWASLLAGVVVAGSLALAFHLQREPDPPPDAPVTTAPLPSAADRTRGPPDARRTAEIVLDLTCAHCATLRPQLLAALADARVTERLVVRRGEPAGRDLARWGVAAATAGRWELFVTTLIGSRSGLTRDELLGRHGDLLRPLDALPGADAVVDADQALLKRLRFDGRTPFVVLTLDGRVTGRWSGDFDPAHLLPPSIGP